MFKHIPVLPEEVLKNFESLDKGEIIVDGTLGRGGHSKILLDKGFKVIGIDRDEDAIVEVERSLSGENGLKIVHSNFFCIKEVLFGLKVEKVGGILLDLGVSTPQLENDERGFGFVGELDMRMDRSQELTAKMVVNEYSEEELERVLYKNGERVNAKNIARSIVEFRADGEIESGERLLEIVEKSIGESYRKSRRHHWATPTFRALRIEVNKDYENIEKFFDLFVNCLRKGGILQIITFHSIEDKIVRKRLRELKQKKIMKLITKKPIEATLKEIMKNSKAKRAKLWVAEMR
ncbi:16S rRNA (cytosine(1402)-N(4))-methyltransferase RsmH [archaeon]|jgi:16S rRNA (cytosine1402-N4)-methyltransferase|nr:16S rRNA (cytosine(1402)-N(4))-methyltransferase RsmH [archaeon]